MKLIKIAVLALALSSCGKKPVIVDAELLEYAMRFEQDMGVSTAGINMVFGELEGSKVGLCSIKNGEVKITVDKEYWATIAEPQRESLMYHELGHCAMGLGHDEAKNDNGCPRSIMFPYLFVSCYNSFRDYYISELRDK